MVNDETESMSGGQVMVCITLFLLLLLGGLAGKCDLKQDDSFPQQSSNFRCLAK
jgi:hypothetical protein